MYKYHLELLEIGCSQASYVSGGICLEWLQPPEKSSASLGKSGSDPWCGIVSH